MNAQTTTILSRHENHDHFWIEDGVLFETYNSELGQTFRYRMAVPLMGDNDRLSDADIFYIETHFLK